MRGGVWTVVYVHINAVLARVCGVVCVWAVGVECVAAECAGCGFSACCVRCVVHVACGVWCVAWRVVCGMWYYIVWGVCACWVRRGVGVACGARGM